MNYHKHGKVVAVVALFLTAILLSGCGGSSGLTPSDSLTGETGNLEITVEQTGAAGRFVPPNTLSVRTFVYVEGQQDPNAFQISGTANLPAHVVLINIPAGPKDIRVWAYDALNGTGNAVAYGVAQMLLLGGRNNSVTVQLQAGRLVFRSSRDGNAELYRATPDGRLTSRLTNNGVTDDQPAASPNGQKIAFRSVQGNVSQIRLIDNATLANTLFADLTGDDTTPAWSPDSNTIIWVNLNGTTYTLQKKNLDGSGGASVSFGSSPVGRPAWSPDGSRIALHYWDGADWEIGVLWANLLGFTVLTDATAHQVYPVWGRDGSSIYCSSVDSAGWLQLAELTSNLYPGGSAYVSLLTGEPWDHILWDVSPDGALLACYANPPWVGNWDVYYYPTTSYGLVRNRIRVTYHSAVDETPTFLPPTTGGGPVGSQ